ncbi:ABC transporter ATP-binding protein [Paenibacillus sp. NFR01]|uniref:ABC transporter ATP-binding protein n=1 Tax=Paenibacillus sp. NFR01 TaxID=1566279 RepID=UPI0008AE3C0A|nr:ABC transporter ATP-binding protein [Paenibacillus sp. NFR01]SET06761.1 sulfonate transport system ATP-binding protein [Paenibacillus sp. NFR01]
MTQTPLLEIHNVSKTFSTDKGSNLVLDRIKLQVQPGEIVSIIGPSGCGKSTLLKIISGLDTEISGEALLEGAKIVKPSRDKGFIFQEHRLFPWLTVERNIAAELSWRSNDVRERVGELIRLVGLQGFEQAYPKQLSGGMSQRVAIARALLRNPKVLLLDEPFGALDAFTRKHMQDSLLEIWRENRSTMLFVTHDIDEAVFLSHRVVVLAPRPGRIKAVIPIDLPYPRIRTSAAFQELRNEVLKQLEHAEPEVEAWSI